MSERISRGVFALSIVAGICWIARLLRRQIWHIIELFGGLERLIVGIVMVIAIDYSGEVLVAILAFSLFWMVLRDDRSFYQLERGILTAVLAGLAFLILTPFSSSIEGVIEQLPHQRAG